MNLKKQSKKEKEFLKLLGLSGTKDILFYLNRHDQGQYEVVLKTYSFISIGMTKGSMKTSIL